MTDEHDSFSIRAKWDQRYRSSHVTASNAAEVLLQYQQFLPVSGRALDLACGLGGNALFLTERGLQVDAWDISSVAIERLAQLVRLQGHTLQPEVRDVVQRPPPLNSFDLIVVTRFLERSLCPAISAALRTGGVLFYQTFTQKKKQQEGPSNPHFLLQEGELRELFSGLEAVAYHEAEEAMLVARKH